MNRATSIGANAPEAALDPQSQADGNTTISGAADSLESSPMITSQSVAPGMDSTTPNSTTSKTVNFFPYAHDFTLQNCTLIDVAGDYIVNHVSMTENATTNWDSTEVNYKHCPPPTHLFTGRQNILNDMTAYFLSGVGNRHVCVLYGLGGVGKTQIGYRFVEICAEAQRFSEVFFIDASTMDTINTDLESISRARKIGRSAGDALRWFVDQHQEWLILFNNADDVTLDLSQFFPRCYHGNILITTRNPELCIHAPNAGFRVPDLEENEAIDLLLSMLSRNHNATSAIRDQATTIVNELGCLPLAIVQAGAYITKTGNLGGYLELYKRNQVELWKKEPGQKHDDYRWTVYTTWQMSVDLLKPATATFLRICSFLHHDGLTEEMFKTSSAAIHSLGRSETLAPLVDFLNNFLAPDGDWDPFLFHEMVIDVQSYSLINFDDANMVFSIHPLIHTWMRTMAEDDLSTQACAHYLVGLSLPLLYDLEGQRLRRALQPHIDAVLRHNKDIPIALLGNFSLIYNENGRFWEAEKLQGMVMEVAKQVLGEEHPYTLAFMAHLATTYRKQGRFEEAEGLSVVVLDMRERILGPEHPETIKCMETLALTYHHQGRLDEAEKLEVRLVDTRRMILGEEHPSTLNSMRNLATTYHDLGQLEKAETFSASALEATKRVLGGDHAKTLTNMANLAVVYLSRGKFSQAEKLGVTVVEAQTRVLGGEHPDTLMSMANLAVMYNKLGRFKKAEELGLTVMDRRSRVLGVEHPNTLGTMGHLALTYQHQGRFDEAEELEVTVVKARKRMLGEEHPDTLRSMAELAVTYRNMGRYNEAERLEVEVLDARQRAFGEEHRDVLTSMANLAKTYQCRGQIHGAKKLAAAAAEVQKRVLGEEHPDTLISIATLAATYNKQGQFDEAERLGLTVVKAQKKVLGEEHPDTLASMADLAVTYRDKGQFSEAERLEVKVLDARKRVLGDDHPDTLVSMVDLAATRRESGFKRGLQKIVEGVFGPFKFL